MLPVEFKQRKNHRDLKNPGDWCRTEPFGFLLLCPVCGQMVGCVGKITSEVPFMCDPWLIGVSIDDFNPCGHQFRIENGRAIQL
jgi:hypothetical protein